MDESEGGSPVQRVSAEDLLQTVLNTDCADLPDDLKARLIGLAKPGVTNRVGRLIAIWDPTIE